MRIMFVYGIFILLFTGCTTTGYQKAVEKYPGLMFHQQNITPCEAGGSLEHPTLTSWRIGDPQSLPKRQGLALATVHSAPHSADLEWLVEPAEQEILLLKDKQCHFLMKKKGEDTFTVYKFKGPGVFEKVRTTPYQTLWGTFKMSDSDNIKVRTREFLFDYLTVAGRRTDQQGVWDIAVLGNSGEDLVQLNSVLVSDKGKIFYTAEAPLPGSKYNEKSLYLVKALHADGTTSIISSIWNDNVFHSKLFGISKAGDYPLYFMAQDLSDVAIKVDKKSDGQLQYTIYVHLQFHGRNYKSLDEAQVFTPPSGTEIVGLRLLIDAPGTDNGALEFDNTDETLFYFDVYRNTNTPKFAVQLKHPNGKKLWHILYSSYKAQEGIDPKGWLDLRQLNAPFPQGTLVGLSEEGLWSITGYRKDLAFGQGIHQIMAQQDSSLQGLADKVNPLLAARSKAYADQMEVEKKNAIIARETYINSLPVECRKHLNAPALFRGCMNGVEKLRAQSQDSVAKAEDKAFMERLNKREINWRKGSMSGDNYYHLDVQKRTRQIDNKIRCDLRLAGCIH